jgi:Fe2+ or Zn2+ uptake regulation protein
MEEDYNKEPIFYCKKCLSLAIRGVDEMLYCDTCGNTEIASTDVETWNKMYENKYGVKYINR